MTHGCFRLPLLAACGLVWIAALARAAGPAATGPQTEKRFPPLQVPAGFRATLFACDPLIEYPSGIARGPRPGTLFVAVDYMTGLGADIVRQDEIRLAEDTDGDGYADRAPVFASGFNSIQGLTYYEGTVFVMHSPYLTAVRDTRGTGKADERRDLFTGLGLAPEKDPVRLHNANGIVGGHDGWLYLALGDHGCDVRRPEGDRLVFEGGGILRCRPDGRDLHVFSDGLRNIYDVALDAELNVFVRDNENDGGDYKIRVCHSFFGADHGYPYLYYERPDEALAPLADLGLGSSAGGVCYLGRQFPPEYHGDLVFCEWGRAVVRYRPARSGSSFGPLKEADLAAGAPNDPYGFKPTDVVVDHDGSLLIADWADGQRPQRGRGRIYRLTYAGKTGEKAAPPAAGLADVPAHVREVWAVARAGGPAAVGRLLDLAKSDPDPRVQVQAVRAIADLTDPVLVRHRLDAGRGDPAVAERVAALAAGRDPRVQLEAVIALGRLRWAGTPGWLGTNLKRPDAALAHAAQWALRRAGNWPAVLKLLDAVDGPVRTVARRAVAEQYDVELVNGLIDRLRSTGDAARRREYADTLARVYKKPAPWVYWGFRPPPRPANAGAWERTEAIEKALDGALADPDRAVRRDVLRRMVREKVPAGTDALGRWLAEEDQPEAVADLLAALRDRPAGATRPYLEAVIRGRRHSAANRLLAVSLFLPGLDAGSEDQLLAAAEAVEDGPVLAELLRAAGARKARAASALVLSKLTSAEAVVRAAALEALTELGAPEAGEKVAKLLDDPDARVRRSAAVSAAKLALRPAADRLLRLARDADAGVRRASLEALRRLREPRAVPVAASALADGETALEALVLVGELGGPEHAGAVAELARRQPSADVLAAAGKALAGWSGKEELSAARRQEINTALAEIHGSGTLLGWHVLGPLPPADADSQAAKLAMARAVPAGARLLLGEGVDSRARFRPAEAAHAWLAYAEVSAAQPVRAEFFTAGAPAAVWLNGKEVHRRAQPAAGPNPERFQADLVKGTNRVVVRVSGAKEGAEFQLRFRRLSATPEHERLTRAVLARPGNPDRGRQVFFNAEKSLCIKCHRLGEQGERFGPELTGLGARFAKVYIVESILEPGRTIAPSFETVAAGLANGKLVSGVKVAETDASVTLVDSQAQKHVLAKGDIEELRKQPVSTMPDGLEKRLTEEEFVDLVAFLAALKEKRP